MIPLRKLAELPRSQMLRKAAKIMGGAEQRLAAAGDLSHNETEYLRSLIDFMAGDEKFSAAQTAALRTAQADLADPAGGVPHAGGIPYAGEKRFGMRRALNAVYHLLLAETGRSEADCDFIEAGLALDPAKRRPFAGMNVYLEDIRSPFNVGSMFRAAESFGAEKIWLSPLCADPRHRRAERTAMGCVDVLPWERLPRDPFAGTEASDSGAGFKGDPFAGVLADTPCFALETGGVPLADFPFPPRGTIIAGSEELGVSPGALAAADASLGRVSIPTYGAKGSLNVSVAFGIAMQAWAAAMSRL